MISNHIPPSTLALAHNLLRAGDDSRISIASLLSDNNEVYVRRMHACREEQRLIILIIHPHHSQVLSTQQIIISSSYPLTFIAPAIHPNPLTSYMTSSMSVVLKYPNIPGIAALITARLSYVRVIDHQEFYGWQGKLYLLPNKSLTFAYTRDEDDVFIFPDDYLIHATAAEKPRPDCELGERGVLEDIPHVHSPKSAVHKESTLTRIELTPAHRSTRVVVLQPMQQLQRGVPQHVQVVR